jgi:tetratricopeptide (TPR) repeat protein
MLETIREFSLECLAAAGEAAAIRGRHVAWCLDLAERLMPELSGPDQARWLAVLDLEHDNLRAALGWAIGQGDAESALRLSGALHRFWHRRGHYAEGRRWLEQALALDGGSAEARAGAMLGAAMIAHFQGEYHQAAVRGEEALARFQSLEDTAGVAAAYRYLGMAARAQGDFARASTLDEEALRRYRVLGDQDGVGAMLNNLGLVAYYQGDYARAAALHEEALALRQALGDRNGAAYSLTNCSLVAHVRGDVDGAAALQEEALRLWWSVGNQDGLAHCFENLALIASSRNELERVARLFAVAEALRVRIGAPGRPNDRESNQRFVDDARARLGETVFRAIWETGRAMSLEAAIDYALADDQMGEECGGAPSIDVPHSAASA